MLSPKVIRIEPEAPYVLLVTFETGERRRFDLSPHLDAGVFQELRQRELFEQARDELSFLSPSCTHLPSMLNG